MGYYLAVETEERIYEGLKIKNSRYFDKKNSSNTYGATLEEIDDFTTKFTDENHLSDHLTSETILRYNDVSKPFAIFYVNGTLEKKVDGNVLYSSSRKYVENPQLVIDYIKTKIEEKDIEFLTELNTKIKNPPVIIYMMNRLITLLKKQKRKNKEIDQKLISTVTNSFIYDYYQNQKEELVYVDKISQEKLHNTISFITTYEKQQLKENQYTRKKEKNTK